MIFSVALESMTRNGHRNWNRINTERVYAFRAKLDMPYEEVFAKVGDALKPEGFRALTSVDMQATLREKLGAEFASTTEETPMRGTLCQGQLLQRLLLIAVAILCLTSAGCIQLPPPLPDPQDELYSFGQNRSDPDRGGQLGQGDTVNRTVPTRVDSLNFIADTAAGHTYSLVLNEAGDVYSFGSNIWGNLGLGDQIDRHSPTKVPGLSGVRAVFAGFNHSFAILADGRIFGWGANDTGQLGLGHSVHPQLSPVEFTALAGVVEISTGGRHTLFRLANGDVYSCGWGGSGELGHSNESSLSTPEKIVGLSNAIAISAGDQSSLVLLANGDVYSFGSNNRGQLGQGGMKDRNRPTKIAALADVQAIEAGYEHALALLENGDVYSFGYNNRGQLGLGDTTDRTTPVKIPGLPRIGTIAAGGHSLVVDTSGRVYAFGGNPSGQLGLGDTIDRLSPVLIPSLSGVELVAVGAGHSLVGVLGAENLPF